MRKLLLIGDSIRRGYMDTVRADLAGAAVVAWPEDNCGDSRQILAHLDPWILAEAPDVVHLNCGLHDLKRSFDTHALQVPLPEYESNLRAIFSRLRRDLPDTVLLWATTTPTNEEWHRKNKPFDRLRVDVAAFNAAALKLAEEFAIPVNDLHRVIMANGGDHLLWSDGVHFTAEGYTILGNAVAEFVRPYLA